MTEWMRYNGDMMTKAGWGLKGKMMRAYLLAVLVLTLAGAGVVPAAGQTAGAAERRALLQQLEKTVVEEVKFEEATLADWVAYLRQATAGGVRPVNFVVTPAAVRAAEGKTVTLELRSVPLRAVLDYGARLLGVEVRIEPHAVVVRAMEEGTVPGAPR